MQRRLELSDTAAPTARRRRSPVIRGLAALAAAAGLALAGASPALAWQDDHPKITDPGVDFGFNWDGFGAPLNGGELHWHVDADGDIDPHLVGNLYLNNASGTTARMQIDYYNAAHQRLHTSYGGEVTARDNDRYTYGVEPRSVRGPQHRPRARVDDDRDRDARRVPGRRDRLRGHLEALAPTPPRPGDASGARSRC